MLDRSALLIILIYQSKLKLSALNRLSLRDYADIQNKLKKNLRP